MKLGCDLHRIAAAVIVAISTFLVALVLATAAAADLRPASTTGAASFGGHGFASKSGLTGDPASKPPFTSPQTDSVDGYDDRSNPARTNARLDEYRLAPKTAPPLFSQTTASRTFRHGPFADQTIGDVAGGLRAGKISPAELPVDVIVRNGETIGLNTNTVQLGGCELDYG